jgi:hypothetical protein
MSSHYRRLSATPYLPAITTLNSAVRDTRLDADTLVQPHHFET